ncbi:hypothetical protein [Methanosphaera cuniculi]|uniref:hypothetical protein n=1 Tax=Methanosphaera cuniculi TaxID=1077256 RepID=UPI0026F27E1C|nr:hypothetical protein [Methanosphaera cuniculi]
MSNDEILDDYVTKQGYENYNTSPLTQFSDFCKKDLQKIVSDSLFNPTQTKKDIKSFLKSKKSLNKDSKKAYDSIIRTFIEFYRIYYNYIINENYFEDERLYPQPLISSVLRNKGLYKKENENVINEFVNQIDTRSESNINSALSKYSKICNKPLKYLIDEALEDQRKGISKNLNKNLKKYEEFLKKYYVNETYSNYFNHVLRFYKVNKVDISEAGWKLISTKNRKNKTNKTNIENGKVTNSIKSQQKIDEIQKSFKEFVSNILNLEET